MNRLSTLSVGIALGVTLALLSMLCALTFALWPDATLDFFGAFSHGLDFGTIKSAAPISPVGLSTALSVLESSASSRVSSTLRSTMSPPPGGGRGGPYAEAGHHKTLLKSPVEGA